MNKIQICIMCTNRKWRVSGCEVQGEEEEIIEEIIKDVGMKMREKRGCWGKDDEEKIGQEGGYQ